MTELDSDRKVLVACIGNPDCGDDGIGALIAQKLAARLPDGASLLVRRGDMLALIEDAAGFQAMVCVDATAAAGSPGRIHRIDLADNELPGEILSASSHGFGLADAIGLAHTLQRAPRSIVLYAIEGQRFGAGAAMTPEVSAAAEEAANRIAGEAARLAHEFGQ